MSLRLMCWFHAIKNIRKRAKDIKLDKQTRIWIYKQLSFLQCAASTQEFVKDSLDQLSKEKPLVILLSKYIFENWIHSDYCNWYEGASDNVSTNNSLERRNRVIKASELIARPSEPCHSAWIAPDIYRQAYQLEKKKRSMVTCGSGYLLPSKSGLGENLLDTFEALPLRHRTQAGNYKKNRSAIHILNHSNGWPTSIVALPSWDKEVTLQTFSHADED
uniref:Transposase n=1 Tax=Ditylenchus dipsaci TaxID=166011 RepID=A0A915E7K0_9BILA